MGLPNDVKLDFRLFFPDSQQKQQPQPPKEPAHSTQKQSRDLKPYRVVAAKSSAKINRDRTNTANSDLSSDNARN